MIKIKHATVYPKNTLNLLSRKEIAALTDNQLSISKVFRDCALAILNTDSNQDDAAKILADFSDFDIRILPQERGIKLEMDNAPSQSFVDGHVVRGIQEHLFAALRDIIYVDYMLRERQLEKSATNDITSDVFEILRNAKILQPDRSPNKIVCWGGHSVARGEYLYAKEVGYQLGLRGLDIVTGCGIGTMKAPMKGATIGHAKQQIRDGRYIGISEPGIIASESPNAIVNELVIMPDIEKRLEAFVRLAHGIVIFPGGVGTLEEILYLLSILMHPDNSQQIPLVLTGPQNCAGYFEAVEAFLVTSLGPEVKNYYTKLIDSPADTARILREGVTSVHTNRRSRQEAFYFNWSLNIDSGLQEPFVPTHEAMSELRLTRDLPAHQLAAQLRSAFSGMVAGNVKAFGIEQVKARGPYLIHGDPEILHAMDELLGLCVEQGRMKLGEGVDEYRPCYKIAGK